MALPIRCPQCKATSLKVQMDAGTMVVLACVGCGKRFEAFKDEILPSAQVAGKGAEGKAHG